MTLIPDVPATPRAATWAAPRRGRTARTTAAGRALSVLDAFGPRHRCLSLSEIARRAGLTLPTAHRLTRELWSGAR